MTEVINATVIEAARFNCWKGRVSVRFAGRIWTTKCEHNHRQFSKAQECADKIAREIAQEVSE